MGVPIMNVTSLKDRKSLLDKAQAEVAEEFEKKAVEQLKNKLRELHRAELVVDNLKEDIKILEEKIKRGDVV